MPRTVLSSLSRLHQMGLATLRADCEEEGLQVHTHGLCRSCRALPGLGASTRHSWVAAVPLHPLRPAAGSTSGTSTEGRSATCGSSLCTAPSGRWTRQGCCTTQVLQEGLMGLLVLVLDAPQLCAHSIKAAPVVTTSNHQLSVVPAAACVSTAAALCRALPAAPRLHAAADWHSTRLQGRHGARVRRHLPRQPAQGCQP